MRDAELKRQLLLRLIYGEVFKHPLTREELFRLVPPHTENPDRALQDLLERQLVCEREGFYYIFEEDEKVERRKVGSLRAEQKLPLALNIGRKIYRFPFVEGVAISGSLSKNVLYEDGDFDYFIITKPQRLWVARTLLILYKKVFLLNSRKHFCVNYFIDTEHLEIEEKNLFTATELATLLPVAGSILHPLFEANTWVNAYSHPRNAKAELPVINKPLFSRMLTSLLNGRLGEWFDRFCLRLTLRRWRSKFKDFHPETFELAMRSRRYVSKHHPNNFQSRVLQRTDEIRQEYQERYADKLQQAGIAL